MPIERFSLDQFRNFIRGLGLASYDVMFIKGEWVFIIPVYDSRINWETNKRIVIRSSVGYDLIASEKAKNSIRIWIEYSYQGKWYSLGKDAKSHTKRTVNWRTNLKKRIRTAWKMALADERRGKIDYRKAVERFEAKGS